MNTLKFNALVLIPSDHCNIACRHCAPECGPALKHAWNVDLFKKCIEEAAIISGLTKRIHFAGGEPFLYYRQMLELCSYGFARGFVSSIVTNGFWAKNEHRAAGMLDSLVKSGLGRVELSTDVFHQEHLPISVVKSAIRILKNAGIVVTLRVVTTRLHSIDETLRQLDPDELDGIEVVGSPAVPVGRAIVAIAEDEFYTSSSGATGRCESLLNLTVRSDGDVFPCCAGSEENPSLSIGNLQKVPLNILVATAEYNLMVKRLVHSGPASFFPHLRADGLGYKIKDRYTNICHACTSVFSDKEMVSSIHRRMCQEERAALASLSTKVRS